MNEYTLDFESLNLSTYSEPPLTSATCTHPHSPLAATQAEQPAAVLAATASPVLAAVAPALAAGLGVSLAPPVWIASAPAAFVAVLWLLLALMDLVPAPADPAAFLPVQPSDAAPSAPLA